MTTTISTLPDLTGTDKQIAYATRLRAEKLGRIQALIERANDPRLGAGDLAALWTIVAAPETGDRAKDRESRKAAKSRWLEIEGAVGLAEYADALRAAVELAAVETSAKWWIDSTEFVASIEREVADVLFRRFL